MSYNKAVVMLLQEQGVEESTMMGTPCLRYRGDFFTMMFEREEALIIKVSPERVNELIEESIGMEFNFTKKKFKKWVLISLDYEKSYEVYMREALEYSKSGKS